jgi:lactaldehyde dehydrogenase/glycolaldehyde dehydrogenase
LGPEERRERGAALRAVADGIRARREDLARLVVAEQGKTITEARGEVEAAAGFFDFFAGFDRAQVGAMFAPDERGEHLFIKDVPYGVVVGIIPWNYPAASFARKVAPAIMAGNAIVLKPHEETPLTALAIAGIIAEAGVPGGVVNVVTGGGRTAGSALVRSPLTEMVTVTGSVRAGREILAAAADNITPVSLELGGKAPFHRPRRRRPGRRGPERGERPLLELRPGLHLQRAHLRAQRPLRRVRGALRPGGGRHKDGRPDARGRADGAEGQRAGAGEGGGDGRGRRRAGGLRGLGGKRPEGEPFERGYWYEPTVLTGVRNDMDIVQDEVFGPVLPIQPFDDFEEAVGLANDSRFGLTAYVFTSDLRRAMRAIDDIDFGEVYINKIGPEQLQGFHQGYRLSGMGGDDGQYGYERYFHRKTVYLRYGEDTVDEHPANL